MSISAWPPRTRISDAAASTLAAVTARSQTPTGNALQVQIGPGDVISSIPVVMEFEHHQIHEGETWRALEQQLSLGTSTVKYAIVVGTYNPTVNGPHMLVECDIYNGAARVDLYAEATYTGGSALTAKNRNRNITSPASPGTTCYTGVTSTNGTLIDSFFVAPGKSMAATGRVGSEWVLKSAATYRIDVIGLSNGTQGVTRFDWYEDLGV